MDRSSSTWAPLSRGVHNSMHGDWGSGELAGWTRRSPVGRKALHGGFADSKILQIHGQRMADRTYLPGATVATQLKDLRVAQQLARGCDLVLPPLESVTALYEQLVAVGDTGLDQSALHKLLWQGGAG